MLCISAKNCDRSGDTPDFHGSLAFKKCPFEGINFNVLNILGQLGNLDQENSSDGFVQMEQKKFPFIYIYIYIYTYIYIK